MKNEEIRMKNGLRKGTMKNFGKGFVDYLKNWKDCLEVFCLYTLLWIAITIGSLVDGITGNDMQLLTTHVLVDLFQKVADLCKETREKKLQRMVDELPDGGNE